MLASPHPSPQPKRHLNRFSHFSQLKAECRRACPSPKKLFSWAPKRFAICCQTVSLCLSVLSCSVLSATLVYCGQTVGRIEMKHGTHVSLGPIATLCWMGTQLPSPKGHSPQFSVQISCGQIAAWIKMSLGMEVGLSPGDFVLDEDQLHLPQRGTAPPIFGPYLFWPNGWTD